VIEPRGLLPEVSWFIYLTTLSPLPVSQHAFLGWVWLTDSFPVSNLALLLKWVDLPPKAGGRREEARKWGHGSLIPEQQSLGAQ
jgi:hypothetical protein